MHMREEKSSGGLLHSERSKQSAFTRLNTAVIDSLKECWITHVLDIIHDSPSVFNSPAGLAQSVERKTLNLKAAGSTPAFGYS